MKEENEGKLFMHISDISSALLMIADKLQDIEKRLESTEETISKVLEKKPAKEDIVQLSVYLDELVEEVTQIRQSLG
ncbi:MAG: hypothetical protein KAU62_10265 [Candidatus Heimdallarchaeota archaeon]|nr:hypothetical protein [Candidatus Heimdallarchaeota archaeon]MCK4611527.1 hypothetical protein [Candidatus Heimdallarchaeota archaeon]